MPKQKLQPWVTYASTEDATQQRQRLAKEEARTEADRLLASGRNPLPPFVELLGKFDYEFAAGVLATWGARLSEDDAEALDERLYQESQRQQKRSQEVVRVGKRILR